MHPTNAPTMGAVLLFFAALSALSGAFPVEIFAGIPVSPSHLNILKTREPAPTITNKAENLSPLITGGSGSTKGTPLMAIPTSAMSLVGPLPMYQDRVLNAYDVRPLPLHIPEDSHYKGFVPPRRTHLGVGYHIFHAKPPIPSGAQANSSSAVSRTDKGPSAKTSNFGAGGHSHRLFRRHRPEGYPSDYPDGISAPLHPIPATSAEDARVGLGSSAESSQVGAPGSAVDDNDSKTSHLVTSNDENPFIHTAEPPADPVSPTKTVQQAALARVTDIPVIVISASTSTVSTSVSTSVIVETVTAYPMEIPVTTIYTLVSRSPEPDNIQLETSTTTSTVGLSISTVIPSPAIQTHTHVEESTTTALVPVILSTLVSTVTIPVSISTVTEIAVKYSSTTMTTRVHPVAWPQIPGTYAEPSHTTISVTHTNLVTRTTSLTQFVTMA